MMEANNSNDNGTTCFAATSSNPTEITVDSTCEACDDVTSELGQKEIRLDTVVKETKPIIDNLEYFPINVLLNIFTQTDDIGLLYLSEVSCRFASITPIVFEERYSNEFFAINTTRDGGDYEIYCALFERFGKFIKAIEVNYFRIHGKHQWYIILQNHGNQFKKLTFNHCHFESDNILQQAMAITHLTLRDVSCSGNIDLPEYRNLQKLEIDHCNSISQSTLNRAIRNSPSLQSLELINRNIYAENITSIAESLSDLKELSIHGEHYYHWASTTPDVIDKMAKSLKHLESLNLSLDFDNIELFRSLSMECKNLKHLKLRYFEDDVATQLFEAVRPFQQIESFHLHTTYLNREQLMKINSMVEHLPHLRDLSFESTLYNSDVHVQHSDILRLFHHCPSLETIKYIFDSIRNIKEEFSFIDARYFENFIETVVTGKPNARIEMQDEDGATIGSVSKNGIVWRNKLVHWTGCDTNQSASNVHLLDLAEEGLKSDAVQKSLLDLVFDYLDVHSLCAFAETSKRSKQLIGTYIPKHSQQQGTFTITDEFQRYDSLEKGINFDSNIFAQHVTDLKIEHICRFGYDYILEILSNYRSLKKLSTNRSTILDFLPQVQHFTFDTPLFIGYSDLYELSKRCSNVETVEFKKATPFHEFQSGKSAALEFRNLKKFTFQYRSETQMNNLKKIFENTDTQLIPIRQN